MIALRALRKTSALLKLAEGHRAALAHVSYVPEGRDIERVVIDPGRAEGLRMAPDLAAQHRRCLQYQSGDPGA